MKKLMMKMRDLDGKFKGKEWKDRDKRKESKKLTKRKIN